MGDSRLNHLGALLDSKNRTVRRESANAFGFYSLCDQKVVEVLLKYLSISSWDSRVSAADAVSAVLSRTEFLSTSLAGSAPVAHLLSQLDVHDVIKTYRPLLSADSATIGSTSKTLSSRQQRLIIDQHLDLQSATGISSDGFLTDAEVLPNASTNSPTRSDIEGEDLQIDSAADAVKLEPGTDDLKTDSEAEALLVFVNRLVPLLADQRWHVRHGVAMALTKVMAVSYSRIPSWLVDNCALRLLQVLVLDQFNDFVTGRNATAPVRETCAQALGHLLYRSDDARRTAILGHVQTMLASKSDKMWHCRQSGLLVLKYFFVVAPMTPIFDACFSVVIKSLDDSVDDVVSCAVSTLSSFLSNESVGPERPRYVAKIMDSVWSLLTIESTKEQLRSGLDSLAIDLMSIIDTWLRVDLEGSLSRAQLHTIFAMIDASFSSRTNKILQLLSLAVDRGEPVLLGMDVFSLLKSLYRVLLFAAPDSTNLTDMSHLELVYITALRVLERYKSLLLSEDCFCQSIGLWASCLMFDHRNPLIDVFSLCVDGASSSQDEPMERMCSEEMRFLTDRDRDNVYITRKILASKFIAALVQTLYQSGKELNGQPIAQSVQLLFVPYLQSSSLYQALGAAVIINEWASVYKGIMNSGVSLDPPMTVVSHCDAYLRAPAKNYEELSMSVNQLTHDCNEFVDYCCLRGVGKEQLQVEDNSSVEEVSRLAFEKCLPLLKTEKQTVALESRYKLLKEFIEFTKVSVRTNTTRVMSFLSSALFYFGFAPEKLTPMVRPLVECMQIEENDTVASEVFKGAVPLMVIYSWPRTPRPYVKVLAKAMEVFPSCSIRIPAVEEWKARSSSIISLQSGHREDDCARPAAASRNAELMLLVCSKFAVEQLPEYYSYFGVDDCGDDQTLLCRLELHGCLWSRVGSCLSDTSTSRVLDLLRSPNPALRFGGAKAVATFARSQLGDTISRVFDELSAMLENISDANQRSGAVEAVLRLSYLGSWLTGVVSLLTPIVFPRLADKLPEIRDAAGEAFRHLVPLLALENTSNVVPGLSAELCRKRQENADFIRVLSAPSELPLIATDDIKGLSNNIQLRHYQMEGITWMRFLRRYGLNGILADDMGLGKTLQTMCAIALSVDNDNPKWRASLIVCPRTLVDHWCGEWRRYFPDRPRALKADQLAGMKWQKNTELVVTAYEDLKNNNVIMSQTWNYVVLDEGHVLRNPKTALWRTACDLQATSRLILSGTPVQNSPADLWALFTWLMPGYLGDEKHFRVQFLKKILRCRNPKASEKDIQEGSASIAHLHKLILPFVMRRMKTEVLKELPDKNVQDYECELSADQRTIYKYIVDRCTANKTLLADGGISPLHALITLRKLVDHPSLIIDVLQKTNADTKLIDMATNASSGKMEALGQLLNECGIGLAGAFGDSDDVIDGEKEDLLSSTVPEMPHRALIFCQWKSSVALVCELLSSGRFGSPVSHLVLDGSVPVGSRQNVVDRFNADHSIDVLVLTTHIGGVGLNLTGADVVIFVDHDWNPMKDLQAIDRAHRLGQTRKVNVYRLITQGTVEEKVMSLHKFKQNTADALIGAENCSLASMATEELLGMFSLDANGGGSAESAEAPATKRRKKAPADESGTSESAEAQWNLAELWDESQYEEQFDVHSFARQTTAK